MKLYLEIEQNGKINIYPEMKNFSPFSVCGAKQPPRDFAAEWKWQEDDKDSILIFISQSLNKDLILSKLEPFLEKAKNLEGIPKGIPLSLAMNQ